MGKGRGRGEGRAVMRGTVSWASSGGTRVRAPSTLPDVLHPYTSVVGDGTLAALPLKVWILISHLGHGPAGGAQNPRPCHLDRELDVQWEPEVRTYCTLLASTPETVCRSVRKCGDMHVGVQAHS